MQTEGPAREAVDRALERLDAELAALARDAVDRSLQRLDAEVAVVMERMRRQAQDAGLLAIKVQSLMQGLEAEYRARRAAEEAELIAKWTAFYGALGGGIETSDASLLGTGVASKNPQSQFKASGNVH